MSWDDLRYLLALERSGTLAAAARALQVDQTTVGRRIDALQERLGTQLVERGPRGSTLTVAGRRACAAAAEMDGVARALARDVVGRDRDVKGVVRITAPDGFIPYLVRGVAELLLRHGELSVEVLAAQHRLNLVGREADLAVRMTRESQPSLVTQRIGTSTWGLYASEAYLAQRGVSKTLAGHDIIGLDESLARTPGGVWLAKNATGARVVMTVNNLMTGVAAAAAGLGILTAPETIALREPALRRVGTKAIGTTEFFLVASREQLRLPRVRAVRDHLARFARSLPELQP